MADPNHTFAVHVAEDVDLPPIELPEDLALPVAGSEGEPVSEEPDPAPDGGGMDAPAVPAWAVEAATSAVFAWIATRRGEHWQLTEDEARAIAEPLAEELAELAERLGWGGVAGAVPFLTERRIRIIAALAAAIVPRYMRDIEIARFAGHVAEPAPEPADHISNVNGFDPEAPGTMADQLKAKQNGSI